jgi:hypothetical protein
VPAAKLARALENFIEERLKALFLLAVQAPTL